MTNKSGIEKSKGSPRVLITGATGSVGPLVVQAFHAKGYVVRILSIDPPEGGLWPDDVEVLIGDVTDRTTVETALEGVDYVVHLAALLHVLHPSPDSRKDYERINVFGTATVVEAALKRNVRRFVFFSTIAVYGPSDGAILTEDTPARPTTLYAQTKLSAESIVLSARRINGEPLGTVLRLGSVYGARIKGNYWRLVRSLANGRFVPFGPGLNRRTLIYDKDVARAVLLVAEHDSAAGKLYNVTDGRFHTLRDIIGAICNAQGRDYPSITVPVAPARWVTGPIEQFCRVAGLQPPITRESIDTYTEDFAVDGSRLHAELGFSPDYNLEDGWKDAVQEMRRIGHLRGEK